MHTLLKSLLLFSLPLLASCNRNVSFIVVSDPHFTGDTAAYAINRSMVEDMNSLKGASHPDSRLPAIKPSFVWMLGDMTDAGKPEEWQQYESLYGLNAENLLNYPVFECFGNHDGNVDGAVRKQIKQRNTRRQTKIHTDSLGLHYSWDVGRIHFVNLNLYPTNQWDPACEWCKYFKESFRESEGSLAFLQQDLKENVGTSGRPVILAFHIGFDDFSLKWWTENDRKNFYEVIKGYNIRAIFHGHNHSVAKSLWNGIEVWSAGSPRHDDKTGEYLVVSVDKNGEISVRKRKLSSWE